MLQERLRERKGENLARRGSIDTTERTLPNSPLKGKEERRPSSSGTGKGMGVKQIEEHVSTLTKQNFNLKLELHHRRERQEALEKKLEAAEKRIEEQTELQEVNEQLLAELEKRDQAVEEAVGIIVSLEEKVERLMKEREIVKAFDANHDPGFYGTSHDEPYNVPGPARSEISNAMARMPSFLSEQSESTEALRSLYIPTEHSYTDSTVPKQSEDAPPTEMDSPRLSVLSESSFLSIYGERQLSLDDDVAEADPETHRHKSESVERWVDDRPVPSRPAAQKRSSTTPRRNDSRRGQFPSINHVLESPLQRLEKLKTSMEKSSRLASTTIPQQTNEKPKTKEMLKRVMTDKSSFDQQQMLPPTPDTVGTNTLRHYQNSNDTLDKNRIADGTFLNSSSTIPAPGSTENAFQSTLSIRPRSAGETVTSRREGHGWDTETQEDDISSIASTFATQTSRRPGRPLTPDLFTYTSEDRYRTLGRDMMFNYEPSLPFYTASRYERLRQSSVPVQPRNDDIARRLPYNSNLHNPPTSFDTTPRPPERRSSLSATGKLRNSISQSPTTPIGNSPVFPQQENKRKGLAGRLFGRSDTSPAVNTSPHQAPKSNDMRRSWIDDRQGNEDESRATPPPIRRSRTGTTPTHRPGSAGVGASNFAMRRQHYAFDTDGANDINDGKTQTPTRSVADSESEHKTGRNWLGFGKAGGLRRT